MADQKKLSAATQAAVDKAVRETKERLDQEYEQKKAEIEAAAARRPWTVVAWSAAIGVVIGLIVRGYLPF